MSRTAPKQEALSEPLLEEKEEALSEPLLEESPADELEEDEGGGAEAAWNLIGMAPWKLASARVRQLAQEDHPDADAGIADADADGPAVEVQQRSGEVCEDQPIVDEGQTGPQRRLLEVG